jgi:hypothetical protein
MRNANTLFSIAALLLAGAAPAFADEVEEGSVPPRPGVHEHDGFYLRFGTGFGGYNETITAENADESSTVSGMSTVGELALGGAIRPGLILGGGVWTSSVMASDRNIRGMDPPDEVIGGSGNFTLIGPFIDWYFNPHRGLHLQGAVGFATVRGWDLPEAQDNPDAVSVGGGVMIGFGYEWWVSNQWAVGVLARIAGVGAVQEDETNMQWTHGIGASPSVLFTATLN